MTRGQKLPGMESVWMTAALLLRSILLFLLLLPFTSSTQIKALCCVWIRKWTFFDSCRCIYLNNCTFIFQGFYRSISVGICLVSLWWKSADREGSGAISPEEDILSPALHHETQASRVSDDLDWGPFQSRNVNFVCASWNFSIPCVASCFHPFANALYTVTVTLWSFSLWREDKRKDKRREMEDIFRHCLTWDCLWRPISLKLLYMCVFIILAVTSGKDINIKASQNLWCMQ